MKEQGFKYLIEKLTLDDSVSLEDRVDMVFNARQELESDNEDDRLANDADCYSCLIAMYLKENGPHIHDLELLQLYALLGETYVEQKAYQRLKEVAYGALDIIRYEVTAWDAMAETLPRIINAVGESVYNHALYELLLIYVRASFQAGKLDTEMKGHVRKMLKLRVLLEDGEWLDRLFDQPLQSAVASLFTADEMLKIIMHPEIGHLRKDPVEYSWRWEDIYYDVEKYLDDRFANAPRQMGFCFHFWSVKREYLAENYGIEWKSPSQMNPRVMFD